MPETQFTQIQYSLNDLMNAVRMGQIGLPDIQREVVWKNIKLRGLFDSMYFTSLLSRSESPGRHQAT